MKKRKINIASVVSLIRIIIVPLIILLFVFKKYKIALIFISLGIMSDFLDNYLAIKLDMANSKQTKIDLIADKIFTIGVLIPLAFKSKIIIVMIILEILIIISNLYYYKKTNRIEILTIGKIKIVALFLTIFISYLGLKFNLTKFSSGLVLMTINLQILSLISYFVNYYQIITRKKVKTENSSNYEKLADEEKMINDETVQVNDLIDLAKKYGTYSDDDF